MLFSCSCLPRLLILPEWLGNCKICDQRREHLDVFLHHNGCDDQHLFVTERLRESTWNRHPSFSGVPGEDVITRPFPKDIHLKLTYPPKLPGRAWFRFYPKAALMKNCCEVLNAQILLLSLNVSCENRRKCSRIHK